MDVSTALYKILVTNNWLRRIMQGVFYAQFLTGFYERLMIKTTITRGKKAIQCKTVQEYVDLAFNVLDVLPFYQLSIRPYQVKEEITKLLEILAKNKPKYVLEIGTARGGTLFLLCHVLVSDGLIISLDLPATRYEEIFPAWKTQAYQSFASPTQTLYLLRKDSHAASTLEVVKKILNGHKLDFLFIDGDHSLWGVKMDFEMYSQLVRKGGLIAMHDICKKKAVTGCQVHEFWQELKQLYPHMEIVNSPNQTWAGIGLLYV